VLLLQGCCQGSQARVLLLLLPAALAAASSARIFEGVRAGAGAGALRRRGGGFGRPWGLGSCPPK